MYTLAGVYRHFTITTNICTSNRKLNVVYIVQSGKCLIDGQCYDASEVNPADESGNCDLGDSSTERTTSKSDYFNIVCLLVESFVFCNSRQLCEQSNGLEDLYLN